MTPNVGDPMENVESPLPTAQPSRPLRDRRRRLRTAIALPAVALTAGAAFLMGTQIPPSAGTQVGASVPTPSETQQAQPADPSASTAPAEEASPTGTVSDEPGGVGVDPTPSTSRSQTPEKSEPTGPSRAEMRWVDKDAGWIVDDVTTTEEYVLDGIAVSSSLNLLADNYGRLVSSPAPPGADEAEYYALAATLEQTARDAADLYYDDPMTGGAKYEVLRGHTQELLDQINSWTGSAHRLPRR